MSLPILTSEQINVLVLESQGRAISFVDSPEWYCGERKSTFMARYGIIPTKLDDGGTCHTLAYTLRDHCAEYQRNVESIAYNRKLAHDLDMQWHRERTRKAPSKRCLSNIEREIAICNQDIRSAEKRNGELVARYFRGYEERLLIGKE